MSHSRLLAVGHPLSEDSAYTVGVSYPVGGCRSRACEPGHPTGPITSGTGPMCMVSISKVCQHTGISNVKRSLRIVIENAAGMYKTRHITTPPETRPELKRVQHERGGKLTCTTISYPRLFCPAAQPQACQPSGRRLGADHPPAATPVSGNVTILGAQLGNVDHKPGEKNNKPYQSPDRMDCSVPRLDLGNITCRA